MHVHRQGIWQLALVLMVFSSSGHAQSTVTPEDEYRKLTRVTEDIQPLGETPFGENISLYSGSLSFEQTDVSAAGTGPLLQVTRTLRLPGREETLDTNRFGFADWEWNLPRITTMTSNDGNTQGWKVAWPSDPNARCDHFTAPPEITFPGGSSYGIWSAGEWWNGYQLVVPGYGEQELLPRTPSNTLSPQMPGKTFPIVTKDHWAIRCLATTSNGEPGQAFLAVSPDGTMYWLDRLVYSPASTITKPYGAGPDPMRSGR